MNPSRLRWLVTIMCALIVLRWLVPNSSPPVVSEAVVRPVALSPRSPAVIQQPQPMARPERPSMPVDTPGNAFAVRRPAAPLALPVPPPGKTRVTIAEQPAAPPQPAEPPAPPPPPPFKVIGTWDDKEAPGVFVSTPVGTVLARKGAVLLAEYRVTAITRQQLSLEHMASKREYQFSVPRAAGP